MSRQGQDDLARQARLNEGRCPTHGVPLVQSRVTSDSTLFECPRADCLFEIVPKRGTKSWRALQVAPKKSTR